MSQPTYSSANGYIGENFFTLHFDVALDAANPPPTSAFNVQINGAGTTVTGVTVDSVAHTVALTFSAQALRAGDIIEFSYGDPTGGDDANAIQGIDGADAATFSSSTIVFGTQPTVVSITPQTVGPTNATTLTETVTFSTAVTGVDASDFTVGHTGTANAQVSSVIGSGDTYTVTLTGVSGDGTIHLDLNASGTGIQDGASNPAAGGATGSDTILDHTPPAVANITPDAVGPTHATTVTETVTFSEAVTGVDAGDFTVNHTGTATAHIASLTGSGDTYTVTLDTIAGDGSIHLDLNSSGTGIQDAAGNAVAGGATGTEATIDNTAPVIAGIAPDAVGPTHATTVTETVTFSEAVTGVDAGDFTVGHTGTATAHIASVTGSGSTYTVTLDTVAGEGTIHLDLNASGTGIEDVAGNAITSGATGTSTVLGDPPQPVSPPPPPTSGGDGGDVPDLRSGGLSESPHTYAGGGGADVIYGGDAGDTLQGNTGDDIIRGGLGADQIHGGQGADQLNAGDGNNLVFGDLGDDSVVGGAGQDTLQGNAGGDSLAGGAGNDVVLGGQDQDRLEGGDGADTLSGDLGHDTLQGNAGADVLSGGAGNDVLFGGQGDDHLNGGDGADFLSGDLGNDTLTGGAGADVFSFAPGGGVDHVTDFNAADGDRVQLEHGSTYTLEQAGANTVIDLGHGDQLVLDNVQLTSLPTGWILS